MKVQFKATLDDFADVNLRAMKRSKTITSVRRRSQLVTGILAGLVVFALVPTSMAMKVFAGISALLISVFVYPLLYRRNLEARLRNLLQEQMTDAESYQVTVELSEKGLIFRQRGTEVTYDWSYVQTVEIAEERVDFLLEGGGMATVRQRAFDSLEHRLEFVDLARAFIVRASEA